MNRANTVHIFAAAAILVLCASSNAAEPKKYFAIGGSTGGVLDADVHPSGSLVASIQSGLMVEYSTGTGLITKMLPYSAALNSVRYSPNGFWAAISRADGKTDIYRTPGWAYYGQISEGGGIAYFDGTSRYLGLNGGKIYRISDLQQLSVTRNGVPVTYTLEAFAGLESIVTEPLGTRVVETEVRELTDSINLVGFKRYFVGSDRSGMFANHDGNGILRIQEFDNQLNLLQRSALGPTISNFTLRFSGDGQFFTYFNFSEPRTLRIFGFNPTAFTFNDYFGYSGNISAGPAVGAIFAPPNWQLGEVRIASFTLNGDLHWLKMPEKWKLIDFTPHIGLPALVACSPDPQYMATASYRSADSSKGVRIWRVSGADQGKTVNVLQTPDTVRGIAYSSDGQRLAVGHPDRIEIWRPGSSTSSPETVFPVACSAPIKMSSKDVLAVDRGGGGQFSLLNINTGAVLSGGNRTGPISFSPDGTKIFYMGTGPGLPTIGDTATLTPQTTLTLPSRQTWLTSSSWSPDGHTLALSTSSIGADVSKLTTFDLVTGRAVTIDTTSKGRGDITFSPDNRQVCVSWRGKNRLSYLNVRDLSTLQEFDAGVLGPTDGGHLSFTSDGSRLITAHALGPILVTQNPFYGEKSRP